MYSAIADVTFVAIFCTKIWLFLSFRSSPEALIDLPEALIDMLKHGTKVKILLNETTWLLFEVITVLGKLLCKSN